MDRKIVLIVIVSILLVHLIISALYASNYNPVKRFVSFNAPTNLDVGRRQKMESHDQISLDVRRGLDSNNGKNTSDVIKQENMAQGRVTLANKTDVEIYNPRPLIHSAMKTLNDESHPQYHLAFDRHIKPVYLLDWVPSPDSDVYFQPISGIDARLYSAYYIECTPPSVRLFAISARGRKHLGAVSCHFLDAGGKKMESQRGILGALKDNHLLNYTAASVECPISSGLRPQFVSVTRLELDLDKSTNQVTIQYPGTERRNFSMCFSPLHSNYNSTYRLVQSIELNRLLGASHFYFYNFSASPQTDQILREYEKEGLVTILPWPLPHLETWYYGQIMAINDCIYRNRMTSRYVVVVDTDEFIIPSKHSNWLDLINDVIRFPPMRDDVNISSVEGHRRCRVLSDMENKNSTQHTTTSSPSFGSFMFKCSFLGQRYLNQRENETIIGKNLGFTKEQYHFFKSFVSQPMIYLKHNDFIFDHGKRSKLIVRPETVISHAIHKTVQHISGFDTAYVNSSTAYLHHYRPYKMKQTSTLDISALRFKDRFYERLRQAVRKFPTIFPEYQLVNLTET